MSRSPTDRALLRALRPAAVLVAGIVVLVVGYLALEARPALAELGTRLWTDDGWHPEANAERGSFGLLPVVVGTLATTAGAVVLAAPLGVLSAVFSRFYAPAPLRGVYRSVVELLAGIPSVVYGLWGLATLAPLVRRIEPPGTSLLTGVLVLGVMILPTVALLADAALRSVPSAHLRAAAALGMSRFGTLRGVVLPAARAGVGIAVVLGTARAVGETMAVLMVCGNVVQVPGSPFDAVRTLTANVALELGYAAGVHRSALFASGLFLMAVVLVLVLAAERLRREEA